MRDQLAVGGVALIAAKSFYFGVGGSVSAFRALAAAECKSGRFEWRSVRTFDDGASNRREVIAITRRHAPQQPAEAGASPKKRPKR